MSHKLATFGTNAAPALAGPFTADSEGGPDATSLCLAWKGTSSDRLHYSTQPWTTQSDIPGSKLSGAPAIANTGADLGLVWAWKNESGDRMSWAADGMSGSETVPNHAHTVSSPALLPVGVALDPDSG